MSERVTLELPSELVRQARREFVAEHDMPEIHLRLEFLLDARQVGQTVGLDLRGAGASPIRCGTPSHHFGCGMPTYLHCKGMTPCFAPAP